MKRHWLKAHIVPALRVALLVFVVSVATDTIVLQSSWGNSKWHEYPSDFLAAFAAFIVAAVWTLRHREDLSKVEAYQSNAYLQQLRINSALTKIHGIVDLCEHGDHAAAHQNCKAAMRQQLRVIQGAMGKSMFLTDSLNLDTSSLEKKEGPGKGKSLGAGQ